MAPLHRNPYPYSCPADHRNFIFEAASIVFFSFSQLNPYFASSKARLEIAACPLYNSLLSLLAIMVVAQSHWNLSGDCLSEHFWLRSLCYVFLQQASMPDAPFLTILAPQNPSICASELHQIRRSTCFQDLRIVKCSAGQRELMQ